MTICTLRRVLARCASPAAAGRPPRAPTLASAPSTSRRPGPRSRALRSGPRRRGRRWGRRGRRRMHAARRATARGAQPVDQRVQMRAQHRGGGPRRGRDGLLKADRAGDGVAQRLGPGGQRLQPARSPAVPRRAAERRIPKASEQRRRDGEPRPPGQQQGTSDADADQRRGAPGQRNADRLPARRPGRAGGRSPTTAITSRRRAEADRSASRTPGEAAARFMAATGLPAGAVAVRLELVEAGDRRVRTGPPVGPLREDLGGQHPAVDAVDLAHALDGPARGRRRTRSGCGA